MDESLFTPIFTRNLVLLSKVIQMIGNGREFTGAFMSDLNPVVNEVRPSVEAYFSKLGNSSSETSASASTSSSAPNSSDFVLFSSLPFSIRFSHVTLIHLLLLIFSVFLNQVPQLSAFKIWKI